MSGKCRRFQYKSGIVGEKYCQGNIFKSLPNNCINMLFSIIHLDKYSMPIILCCLSLNAAYLGFSFHIVIVCPVLCIALDRV